MAEFLTEFDKRSAYCAELSAEDLGKRVCVMGWVQKQRDLGALIFIDLRDRTGIVQLAFDDKTDKAIFDTAFGIRAEYTLCAKGTVLRAIILSMDRPSVSYGPGGFLFLGRITYYGGQDI